MTTATTTFPQRLSAFAADIKLSHTVFAMPFALLATVLAARSQHAWPAVGQLLLIVGCMVFARSFAMGMNRLLDAKLDATNPRTARRAIPSGTLSTRFVLATVALCAIGFIATTAGFLVYRNLLPLALSIPALTFVGAYPLLKRFTRLCHYYLGAALGLAPICAWIAIAGRVDWTPVLLGLAVTCWTAGFDVIYACQDYESDRATGIFSIPAKLGIGRALWVARGTHVVCVTLLIAAGLVNHDLHALWYAGVAITVALLVYEHSLVKPSDLSKVNLAFFTLNGIISIVLGTLGIVDAFL
ncbi:MAG: UbiA-like polyprenyltransferase [Tepidisphaeraceae bacterium]